MESNTKSKKSVHTHFNLTDKEVSLWGKGYQLFYLYTHIMELNI